VLDVDTLRIGARDAVYLEVKQRAFPARFTPAAQTLLSDWIAADSGGAPVLVVHGRETRIPDAAERAAAAR
jgi:hypothetical protein